MLEMSTSPAFRDTKWQDYKIATKTGDNKKA